jgi:hypothetical protein
MIDIFDPTDGYWFVGNDQSKVYSSARTGYVSVSDSTYKDWASQHATPTVQSAQDLLNVLINRWLPLYFAKGVQIKSTGTSSLNGTYSMDDANQQRITSIATSIAAGRGLPGGGSTFNYQGHTFNADQFLDFATAAENWVYAVGQALGSIVLNSSGSMPSQPVTIS